MPLCCFHEALQNTTWVEKKKLPPKRLLIRPDTCVKKKVLPQVRKISICTLTHFRNSLPCGSFILCPYHAQQSFVKNIVKNNTLKDFTKNCKISFRKSNKLLIITVMRQVNKLLGCSVGLFFVFVFLLFLYCFVLFRFCFVFVFFVFV